MVSKIITPWEFLVTVRAFIVPVKILLTLLITYFAHEPVSTVLCYMPLPIALYCELEAALIANKGFNTPKKGKKVNIWCTILVFWAYLWDLICCSRRASLRYALLQSWHLNGRCLLFLCCHMWLSRLHLATNSFLQISQLYGFCPWCFTLKNVRYSIYASEALNWYLPNVLVDRSLVKYLRAYWTPSIVICFLALWHKVTLMFHSDMSCKTAGMNKHLQTVSTFLGNLFMLSLLMPV